MITLHLNEDDYNFIIGILTLLEVNGKANVNSETKVYIAGLIKTLVLDN